MTKEYISRDEMIEQTKARIVIGAPRYNDGLRTAIEVATSISAADVVEMRHGRWINERWEGLSSFSAECNLCGKRTLAYFHYFYCPNCGAKMDGEENK